MTLRGTGFRDGFFKPRAEQLGHPHLYFIHFILTGISEKHNSARRYLWPLGGWWVIRSSTTQYARRTVTSSVPHLGRPTSNILYL